VASLTVIWWRDIPAQVIARDRRQTHKIVLHPRFQTAIDRAAMKAGRKKWDDYIDDWRKEQRACGDDVEAEASAEADRLDRQYTRDELKRLVESGGLGPQRAATAGAEPPA